MIRLTTPSIEEDDLQAVHQILTSGYLVQGPRVEAFEQEIANYVGCRHAIAVSNGTAALHLALLALEVTHGDIVLVTAYSWISTANVIELCGAQPAFVDIDPTTFNMDPTCLKTKLERLMNTPATARRVKAILPVHTFGQMADMPEILELSGRYELPVVEDAACALGAKIHDRQAGIWGVLGCFSFHPRKAITTGEGGAITTNNDSLAYRLRALRNHGQAPDVATTDFVMPGLNYRLTEFQAALGLTQMSKLNRIIDRRRKIAKRYDQLLADLPVQVPVVTPNHFCAYQSYVILLPAHLTSQRPNLIRFLRERGIETTIGTWHMPLTTYYQNRYGFKLGDFPVTDQVFARSLTLPLSEYLTEYDQIQVVTHLRQALLQAS